MDGPIVEATGIVFRAGQTVGGRIVMSLFWSLAIISVFAPLAVRMHHRTVN